MTRSPLRSGTVAVLAVISWTFLSLGAPPANEPADLRLAVNGQPQVPVVISDKASDSTKKVAAELAGYLSRMTGGRFEVQSGDGKRGIVLGSLAEFPQPDLAQTL